MEPVAYFSPSSLDAFETCAKKYELRYVLRLKPPERTESVEVFLGSRVHESLEELFRRRTEGDVLSADELVADFDARWLAAAGPQITIARPGRALSDYRDLGEQQLRRFHARNGPFDREETLGLELPIAFPLDRAGTIRIRGFVDRLALAPDGTYEIQDYKTGARLPSRAQLEQNRQLALYQLGVQHAHPQATPERVRLVWFYLAHDARLTSIRSQNQLADLSARTLSLAEEIRSTRDFPPRTGRHCDWCDWKPLCPAFARPGAPGPATGASA